MDQGWKSSDNDISAYLVEPKPPADSRRKQPAYRTAGSDKSTGTYSDQPPSESLQHSAATQEDLLGRAPDASLIAKSSAATATDTADSVLYPISYLAGFKPAEIDATAPEARAWVDHLTAGRLGTFRCTSSNMKHDLLPDDPKLHIRRMPTV